MFDEDGIINQHVSVSESPEEVSSQKESGSGRNRPVSRGQAKSDDPMYKSSLEAYRCIYRGATRGHS